MKQSFFCSIVGECLAKAGGQTGPVHQVLELLTSIQGSVAQLFRATSIHGPCTTAPNGPHQLGFNPDAADATNSNPSENNTPQSALPYSRRHAPPPPPRAHRPSLPPSRPAPSTPSAAALNPTLPTQPTLQHHPPNPAKRNTKSKREERNNNNPPRPPPLASPTPPAALHVPPARRPRHARRRVPDPARAHCRGAAARPLWAVPLHRVCARRVDGGALWGICAGGGGAV